MSRHSSENRPSSKLLGDRLKDAGITINDQQLDQLWRYHSLLRLRNQDRDLTRLVGFESMVLKHYIDCMIVGTLTRLPSPLLDIGTGAGFPGIPLKIRYPHLDLTLAEPRPRRVQFLKDAIGELRLSRISVFDHKVVSRSYRIPMAGIITRAVETMDKTFLRSSAATQLGTQLIFMKGPNVTEELADFESRFGGYVTKRLDHAYRLPGSTLDRRLIVFEIVKRLEDTKSFSTGVEDETDEIL